MIFAEKLKVLRKQFKLSQEQLAEKIGVSRQAITKWETEVGLPDIENLMAIAALFSISIDELLSGEKLARTQAAFAYESITEYDVRKLCHFDIHAPGALEITMTASENEKLRIRLASHVHQTLESDYKVQIDEHRNRMDVNVHRSGQASDSSGKENLYIEISLPSSLCETAELSAITHTLRLTDTTFPIELDGKAGKVLLEGANSSITLNCNIDMDIRAEQLPAVLEINQINATSALHIPESSTYHTKIKGKTNKIIFTREGGYQGDVDSESRIELAGMNAELVIDHDT